MAVVSDIFCHRCKQSKRVMHSLRDHPTICGDCKAEVEAEKRAQHFAELDNLTVEQRLRRLEEWVYDYRPPVDPMNTPYG